MVLILDGRQAGFSGDIFVSSLTDLLGIHEEINAKIAEISKFFNLNGNKLQVKEVSRAGFTGSELEQLIESDFEKTLHLDELFNQMESCANALQLDENMKKLALKILNTLVKAEMAVHGVTEKKSHHFHFHELNSIDTFVDILMSAYLLKQPQIEKKTIIGLPVRVGTGWVEFSHGKVQVPPPAVLEILKTHNYPFFEGDIHGEFLTPTGVAILVNAITDIREVPPTLKIDQVGYGFGKRTIENYPNRSKVILATTTEHFASEQLFVLETHVDDVSGETLGAIFDKLFQRGALDVSIYHLLMKKNRPGHCVRVLSKHKHVHKLTSLLIRELGTLGVRQYQTTRHFIPREIRHKKVQIDGAKYEIQVKVSRFGNHDVVKAEFDDILTLSKKTGKSLIDLEKIVNSQLIKKKDL